jgi:hypothetical protein
MEKTPQQQEIARQWADTLGIDIADIYFLNAEKPTEFWLSPNALTTLARKSSDFQSVDEAYVDYIAPLEQIVHRAVVIDAQGRAFARTGVATLKEKSGMDEHFLAAGRALSAALTAAGFNPLKAGNLVMTTPVTRLPAVNEVTARNARLGQIHLLAERKGLEVRRAGQKPDDLAYRRWLNDNFKVWTTARMTEAEHQRVIAALNQLPDFDASAIEEEEYHEMEVAA